MNRRDYLKGLAASALLLKISPAWNVLTSLTNMLPHPACRQEANAPGRDLRHCLNPRRSILQQRCTGVDLLIIQDEAIRNSSADDKHPLCEFIR